MVEALPTLVKVTAVPGSISELDVDPEPMVTKRLEVVTPTTGSLVITDPIDIESQIATLVTLLIVKAVVPMPAVLPTATEVNRTSVNVETEFEATRIS